MPSAGRRHPASELTRIALVPAPRPRHGRLLAATLLALALGTGAALVLPQVMPAADPPALAEWQRRAEQARLAHSLAEARAEALERQIDTLNQQLREAREELTFVRQARDPRR
jgi:hypothetical protein